MYTYIWKIKYDIDANLDVSDQVISSAMLPSPVTIFEWGKIVKDSRLK